MKSWLKAAILITLTISAFVAVTIWIPIEPDYQGKRLSEWASDIDFDTEFFTKTNLDAAVLQQRETAIAAIRHIGTNALPVAMKLCRSKDSRPKEKIEEWCGDREWKIPFSTDQDKQVAGQKIIWALGAFAKPAIPDLIKLFQEEHPSIADMAAYSLRGIGSNSIPPLIKTFTNGNARAKIYAASTLGMFGSQAREAVPVLVAGLQKGRFTRDIAAEALGNIGEDAQLVVPALAENLKFETNFLAFDVYVAIGKYGTNAQLAIPVLREIIDSKRLGYLAALRTLQKINPAMAEDYASQLGFTNQTSTSP